MSNGGEQGTVTIGEYEIRYHENGEIIDPDNYNALANAVFWLKDKIITLVWKYLQQNFKPARYTSYEGIRTFLSGYQDKYKSGYYNAAFMTPVYTYHFNDLKAVLSSSLGLEWHLADWMVEDGYAVSSEIYDKISNALQLARGYPHLRGGDIVQAEHFNMLVDLALKVYDIYEELLAALMANIIYMLPTGDWGRAKELITDGSVVFISYSIGGVYGSDIKPYLDDYRCIVVNLIDTQPYYGRPLDTFYDILYTSSQPTSATTETCSVIHPCFQARIGTTLPAVWDYAISHIDKRSDAVIYAQYVEEYVYSWCYVAHAKGYVIEAPFDGTVADASNLTNFMNALRGCLISEIINIIYLAGYSAMDGQVNVADILRAYAEQIGWRVIDMR